MDSLFIQIIGGHITPEMWKVLLTYVVTAVMSFILALPVVIAFIRKYATLFKPVAKRLGEILETVDNFKTPLTNEEKLQVATKMIQQDILNPALPAITKKSTTLLRILGAGIGISRVLLPIARGFNKKK